MAALLYVLIVAPMLVTAGSAQTEKPAGEIRWVVPEDGGTPRDPKRIEAVGPREFRIRASVAEGESVLKHAASRLDLLCRNDGTARAEVNSTSISPVLADAAVPRRHQRRGDLAEPRNLDVAYLNQGGAQRWT